MKSIEAEKDICSFLKKKLELFKQYLSITKGMVENLKDKGASHLGDLLSQRQNCIRKIERIDSSIEKIMKASSDKGGGPRRGPRSIDDCLKNMRGIMEKVDLMDKELMGLVKAESESIKRELLEMRHARQAAKGYKNEVRRSPRFLDTIR